MAAIDLADNFDRPSTGTGWGVTSTGAKPWSASGLGTSSLSAGTAFLTGVQVVDAETPDVEVTIDSGIKGGIAARQVDDRNFWRLSRGSNALGGSEVRLDAVINGSVTVVRHLSTIGGQRLKLVSRSTGVLQAFVADPNGVLPTTPTWDLVDSRLATATRFGAASHPGNSDAGVDNFSLRVLNVPPTAPTTLAPNGSAVSSAEPVVFSWQHNDPGDPQARFDLYHRAVGAATFDVVSGGSASSVALTLAAGDYEWEVQTGDAAGFTSPRSARAFFAAAVPPGTPTIQNPLPGATIGLSTHTVIWSSSAQEAYQLRVLDAQAGQPGVVLFDTGTVLEAGTRSHVTQHPVNNRVEYVQVRTRSAGLWSGWATVRYTVTYTPPVLPTYELDARGPFPRLRLAAMEPEKAIGYGDLYRKTFVSDQISPTVTACDVFRRPAGSEGPGVRMAAGLRPGAEWLDPYVAHLEAVEYAVLAYGDNGTTRLGPWTPAVPNE